MFTFYTMFIGTYIYIYVSKAFICNWQTIIVLFACLISYIIKNKKIHKPYRYLPKLCKRELLNNDVRSCDPLYVVNCIFVFRPFVMLITQSSLV